MDTKTKQENNFRLKCILLHFSYAYIIPNQRTSSWLDQNHFPVIINHSGVGVSCEIEQLRNKKKKKITNGSEIKKKVLFPQFIFLLFLAAGWMDGWKVKWM